jgi:hypothetical protein
MTYVKSLALGAMLLCAPFVAEAGCLKGAAVGGVAGHVAGHHAVLGAAAGCAIGHHETAVQNKKNAQAAAAGPAPAAAPQGTPPAGH